MLSYITTLQHFIKIDAQSAFRCIISLHNKIYERERLCTSNLLCNENNLYCTPVKFTVSPTADRQTVTFRGCVTVNFGGLQYNWLTVPIFLQIFQNFFIPTVETLFLLALSILAMESADSIRSLYRHFLSGITKKSLNAFYYSCSCAKADYSKFMNVTAAIAQSLYPKNCCHSLSFCVFFRKQMPEIGITPVYPVSFTDILFCCTLGNDAFNIFSLFKLFQHFSETGENFLKKYSDLVSSF